MVIKDETDGTPEWAKRMFRRLRAARWRFVVFMFFVVIPAFGAYRLLQAAIRGEVWHERSDSWISYSAEPRKFLIEIAVWVIAVIAPSYSCSCAQDIQIEFSVSKTCSDPDTPQIQPLGMSIAERLGLMRWDQALG